MPKFTPFPISLPEAGNDSAHEPRPRARHSLRVVRRVARPAARLTHSVEVTNDKRLRLKPKKHPFSGQNWDTMHAAQRWAFLRHVLQELGYLDEDGNVEVKR